MEQPEPARLHTVSVPPPELEAVFRDVPPTAVTCVKDAGRRWYAALPTADGVQLTVQEFGGGGEKEPAGAADPLLSMAQLTAIVRSPA